MPYLTPTDPHDPMQCPITGDAQITRHISDGVDQLVWDRADPETHIYTDLLDQLDAEGRAFLDAKYVLGEPCPRRPDTVHARLHDTEETPMTHPTHHAIAADLRRVADTPGIGGAAQDRLLMLAAEVDALAAGEPATAELEAVAAGLDPEQEIRARALTEANHMAAGAARALWTASGQPDSPTLLDLADILAAWIRDGSRP
jgi:hypothetical protein